MPPEAIAAQIDTAQRELRPLRLHLTDGEVLTARVLAWDGRELVYAPLHSSRPERYGICDSTGFAVALGAIERAQLQRPSRA
jgi:hypothetical protein